MFRLLFSLELESSSSDEFSSFDSLISFSFSSWEINDALLEFLEFLKKKKKKKKYLLYSIVKAKVLTV